MHSAKSANCEETSNCTHEQSQCRTTDNALFHAILISRNRRATHTLSWYTRLIYYVLSSEFVCSVNKLETEIQIEPCSRWIRDRKSVADSIYFISVGLWYRLRRISKSRSVDSSHTTPMAMSINNFLKHIYLAQRGKKDLQEVKYILPSIVGESRCL